MLISFNILIISISFLSHLSEFTEINSTTDNLNIERIPDTLNENDNISILEIKLNTEKPVIDQVVNDLREVNISESKIIETENNSPNIPVLSTNTTSDESKSVDRTSDSSEKIEISHNQTGLGNDTHTDDMPTFDEYRQMLEKESKQKREKADSIPSSPTMIVKDKIIVKASSETISPQSSNKEAAEPNRSGSSSSPILGQETKSPNTEKIDLKIHQVPLNIEEVKIESRTATLTKKLLKNNVAAKECGAKMLEFSSQITNADYVLNNNKDEYLNVPCSLQEKWFILETCEPVQIRSIQIANFEMFSSRPKTFKVYSSDRYPVKHWYNLGLFRAHDEKGIQTFTISDSNMVKYIKFELVDHYGNEHYCPLTFVRILGNVVIDEMDEETDDNQLSLDDDAPIDKAEFRNHEINSDGILTKAKDMLVKMVNGIGGSKKQDSDKSFEDLANIANKLDENISHLVVSESPCYFIDFLLKETNFNCDIWNYKFQRFVELEKYISCDTKTSLESHIISLPFPFQIRVDYFTIYHSIISTQFDFDKLHHSFINFTMHSSKDVCIQKPWQNLSSIFKCNLILNKNPKLNEPQLPNITGSLDYSNPVSFSSSSTVDIPNIQTLESNTEDIPSSHLPGQTEIFNGNNRVKVSSTSGYPLPSNETNIEESLNSERNNSVENSNNKDGHNDKINSVNKESESENGEALNVDIQNKGNFAKSKVDDITDQKYLATPGSNAWNQAFMRIKNMARQLEVNVTISMKYLEELSQNYKQQTERLKKAQSTMAENVSNLETVVNQHHQETQKSIDKLNNQLESLIIKIKYGLSNRHLRSKSRKSLNLTNLPENEIKCVDILAEELLTWSWWDSPYFVVFMNVLISVLCNLMFLAIFYNRLRGKIMSDIEKTQLFQSKPNPGRCIDFSFVSDFPIISPSRSCNDLCNSKISQHPVVLPPRGVNFSFIKSNSTFDYELKQRNQFEKELGPHFYAVQPNFNFVTPSKDRKKKRKK